MRYEYKKLFSSKLMWFMLLLTLGYMVFLPLREVWANIENSCASFSDTRSAAERGGQYNGIKV